VSARPPGLAPTIRMTVSEGRSGKFKPAQETKAMRSTGILIVQTVP
jgi:hypothetical protein